MRWTIADDLQVVRLGECGAGVAQVRMDLARAREVLVQLIENANRYSPGTSRSRSRPSRAGTRLQ